MILAALFDFDGVLVDSERVHFWCWNAALEPEDVELSPIEYATHFSGNKTSTIAIKLVDQHKLKTQPHLLRARKNHAFSKWIVENGIPLVESARDSINRLLSAGIRLGIVTSSEKDDVRAILERSMIIGSFETIIAAEKVDTESSKSKSYRDALAMLDIPAKHCVALEDTRAGIVAARAVGLRCIGIRHGADFPQDLSLASEVFDNLSDAACWILDVIAEGHAETPKE